MSVYLTLMSKHVQPPPIREDDLQLSEDRVLQNRLWSIQRFAWGGFALLLLAALVGFTGAGGYFSHQTLRIGDATAELPRVARWQTADSLTLTVPGAPHVDVTFGPTFRDYFAVEQIQPQPERSEATPTGLRLRFSLAGGGPKKIHFQVRPSRPGWTSFDVSIGPATTTARLAVLP